MVAQSTMESEYIAANDAENEAVSMMKCFRSEERRVGKECRL